MTSPSLKDPVSRRVRRKKRRDRLESLFERMCAGKEKFPSQAAAKAALDFYGKQHRIKASSLSAYECGFGEHWHVGNN